LAVLTPEERRKLAGLLPAVTLMAIFELTGVASVIPFLQLVADPEAAHKEAWVAPLRSVLGPVTDHSLLLIVGFASLGVIAVGNTVSAITTYALIRFSWLRNHSIGMRLLESYLHRPYTFFLNKNSSELSRNILAEVQQAVVGVILQIVTMLARLVVVLFVFGGLLFVDPVLAVAVTCVFGGVYGMLFWSVRRRLGRIGNRRLAVNSDRFKIASEAFAGIKEIQLRGVAPQVTRAFGPPSLAFAEATAQSTSISMVPRFALEAIAFGGVLMMVMYMIATHQSLSEVVPLVGLYAFAAYRILPALQTVFAGATTIRFSMASLETLAEELRFELPSSSRLLAKPVPMEERLELEGAGFRYPETDRWALDSISLTIQAGEWIALVGPTGSGKTTLVDVLLGLLPLEKGSFRIDGTEMDETRTVGWQRSVGYVPQQIFLIDDTIGRNICFDAGAEVLDREAIIEAAKLAQVHEFIESLPEGYDTMVGERGVRLSGGQRQRIGIARALYRKPRFLVLDEATSALDGPTEAAFFAEIRKADWHPTVVSIAHRLSTTYHFDRILLIHQGNVVCEGTPADVKEYRGGFSILRAA